MKKIIMLIAIRCEWSFFLIIKKPLLCFLFFLHIQILVVLVVEFVLEECQFL